MATSVRRDAMRFLFSHRPAFRRMTPVSRFFSTIPARRASDSVTATSPSIDSDLESTSFVLQSHDELVATAKDFDPATQTGEEQHVDLTQVTPPPKFYRGPLNPIQPPEKTDISSREFVPGPFMNPRFLETYESTVAPDILTMLYQHNPDGIDAKSPIDHSNRLRRWEGESPYYAGRPARPARGAHGLDLIRHPIRYDHIPHIQQVVIHSMVTKALKHKPYFDVASMVLQSITSVRCQVHESKKNILEWDLTPGKLVGLTATLQGEDMSHFLSKLVDVVLPRVKDWAGVSAKSGDRSGNVAFGLRPDAVALFPEIESNFDAYPTEMIPGCHIIIQTSAETDRDARLLLSGMGFPFNGPLERSRV